MYKKLTAKKYQELIANVYSVLQPSVFAVPQARDENRVPSLLPSPVPSYKFNLRHHCDVMIWFDLKFTQTYRKEVSGAHGEEFDEGLHGKDGGEKVVAVQQQRVEKRWPAE